MTFRWTLTHVILRINDIFRIKQIKNIYFLLPHCPSSWSSQLTHVGVAFPASCWRCERSSPDRWRPPRSPCGAPGPTGSWRRTPRPSAASSPSRSTSGAGLWIHPRSTIALVFGVAVPKKCRKAKHLLVVIGVRSESINANAHRETHKCKHTDSQMRTEQFINIFNLQMHAERFTNTFQCHMNELQFVCFLDRFAKSNIFVNYSVCICKLNIFVNCSVSICKFNIFVNCSVSICKFNIFVNYSVSICKLNIFVNCFVRICKLKIFENYSMRIYESLRLHLWISLCAFATDLTPSLCLHSTCLCFCQFLYLK